MKTILQRILRHASGIARVRNTFAQVRAGRFDEWPGADGGPVYGARNVLPATAILA